jgi:TolB-like protein/DNA-binding SARP family transcriptional activator
VICLRILGSVELQTADGREIRAVLAQPKRLAVLAYLAASRPGGFHRRDQLVELFWSELDAPHARNALSQAISHLRRALGDVLIARGAEEIGVDVRAIWCDVNVLRSALEHGDYEKALSLYRGDLLIGFFADAAGGFEDWLDRERTDLRRETARAALLLGKQYEDRGDASAAVACARRAVALMDSDERAVRQLITMLDRLGDRAGALEAYAAFAARLKREFDAEPASETRALVARVRSRLLTSDATQHEFENSSRASLVPDAARVLSQSYVPVEPSLTTLEPRSESVSEPPARTRGVNVWRLATAVCGLLAILLAALAVNRVVAARELVGHPRATSRQEADSSIRSLAVLPLRNVTGDPQQDYFAEGLTAALGAELAQVRSIQVVSATSAQRYLSDRETATSIAKKLGVDALLEGTVRLRGTNVDVTVSLIDGRSDRRIWTRSYERDLADISMLFGEAAEGVAAELTAVISDDERAHLRRTRRIDPAAYQAYLKGEYFRKRWMEGGCLRAEALFREAIALDSTFADSFAKLASCYVHPDRLRRPAAEVHRQAVESLRRALALDSGLASAYYNLGLLEQRMEYDWPAAGRSFRHAVALDPNDADAERVLGEFLYLTGSPDEGIRMMQRSILLDPFQLDNRVSLGFGLRNLHRYGEAERELQKTLQIELSYSTARLWLAEAFASEGKQDDAVREYLAWLREVLVPGRAPKIVDSLARTYQHSGWSAFWQQELDLAKQEIRRPNTYWTPFFAQYCGPYYMARRYARLGQRDEAIAALEEAYDKRRHLMVFMKMEPLFVDLQHDERFINLSRRVGLE